MKQSQREIAQAILWSFEQLEEQFRQRAAYSIMAIAHPSEGDYTRHSCLSECADVVKYTIEEMRKAIPDA